MTECYTDLKPLINPFTKNKKIKKIIAKILVYSTWLVIRTLALYLTKYDIHLHFNSVIAALTWNLKKKKLFANQNLLLYTCLDTFFSSVATTYSMKMKINTITDTSKCKSFFFHYFLFWKKLLVLLFWNEKLKTHRQLIVYWDSVLVQRKIVTILKIRLNQFLHLKLIN